MSRWNVAIADDNERMAELLDHTLKQDSDFAVVGIAHNGEETCRMIFLHRMEPDVMQNGPTARARHWNLKKM